MVRVASVPDWPGRFTSIRITSNGVFDQHRQAPLRQMPTHLPAMPHRLQIALQHQLIDRVIFDHQNRQRGHWRDGVQRAVSRGRSATRPQARSGALRTKVAPLPQGACHSQFGPHHLGKAATDRKTKPRAAILPRGLRVFLFKHAKDTLLRGGCDTLAGIANLNPQTSPRLLRRDTAARITTAPASVNFNALDTRLNTIWRNLPISPDRAGDSGSGRSRRRSRPFSSATGAISSHDIAQHLGRVKGADVLHQDTAFNFRIIQNIVQNGHQPLARGQRRLNMRGLFCGQPILRSGCATCPGRRSSAF